MTQTYNPQWIEKYTIDDIAKRRHLKPSLLSIVIEWIVELGNAAGAAIKS